MLTFTAAHSKVYKHVITRICLSWSLFMLCTEVREGSRSASITHVLKSRLPKREPGIAAGATLWEYVDARVDQIVKKFGDIDFMVTTKSSNDP
jgi:hypothetical protein